MLETVSIVLFAAALAGLAAFAFSEHRQALKLRHNLLNDAAGLFRDSRIAIAPDHFPTLEGRLPDGRQVRIELLPDTLVFRRLPQLWLKLTLFESGECRRPTIGALSRPTGAEFYSVVHEFPQWIAPAAAETPLLLRGDSCAPQDARLAAAAFQKLFQDPAVKEATITPRAVRVIRQTAEGDRGAHVLLRQARFPLSRIPPDLVRKAISEVEALSELFRSEPVWRADLARTPSLEPALQE